MNVLAIDLGTTNSVGTVPGARDGDLFFTPPKAQYVSVVLDKLKRRFTPSVVAEDQNGNIVVGNTAKARAGLSPEPIMFAKRYMASDKVFHLDKQGDLYAKDVSAHILGHLKKLAEEALGEEITDAVITVPAYFELRAKQMTTAAAKQAGLNVLQLAQEPVAAALMYCTNDDRDPLTIMTYDLGGGTFDVALMHKENGPISSDSILAFDGDPFLGGYNFDKTLAHWIMEELIKTGYSLNLDLDNPKDTVAFAKLMVIAEQTKIVLSRNETHVIQEPASGIIDHDGNPVTIELEVSQSQFEEMISDDVDTTVSICSRALTKANMTPDQIDEIVMVGGSSRIPLVSQRLEAAFGKLPKLVDPDMCVAYGACIIAASIDDGETVGRLKLASIPTETDEPTINISGSLVADGEFTDTAGCNVSLSTTDGSFQQKTTTDDAGAFAFMNVPLAMGDTLEFRLQATDMGGEEVASHQFSVTQSATGGDSDDGDWEGGTVPDVISKPINIMTVSGFYEIAPPQSSLPLSMTVTAKKADKSNKITIPILEENTPLGEIVLDDLPDDLPIGSTIEITLTVRKDFMIESSAFLPALGRKEEVELQIPPPPVKSLSQLRREFELLSERAEEALEAAVNNPAIQFEKAAQINELRDLVDELPKMLAAPNPDCPRIQNALSNAETLIRVISGVWQPSTPPRSDFDGKVGECKEKIEELVSKVPEAKSDGYDQELDAILKDAEQACNAHDDASWNDCFTRVVKLCDKVHARIPGTTPPGDDPPPPGKVLLFLGMQLGALRVKAEKDGKLDDDLTNEFDEAKAELEAIDPNAGDFWAKVRDWHNSRLDPLQKKVEGTESGPPRIPGLPNI